MKVILHTSRIDGHVSQMPGQTIDVEDGVGRRLIQSGQARAAGNGGSVQTASLKQTRRGRKQVREEREVQI